MSRKLWYQGPETKAGTQNSAFFISNWAFCKKLSTIKFSGSKNEKLLQQLTSEVCHLIWFTANTWSLILIYRVIMNQNSKNSHTKQTAVLMKLIRSWSDHSQDYSFWKLTIKNNFPSFPCVAQSLVLRACYSFIRSDLWTGDYRIKVSGFSRWPELKHSKRTNLYSKVLVCFTARVYNTGHRIKDTSENWYLFTSNFGNIRYLQYDTDECFPLTSVYDKNKKNPNK